MIDSNKTTGNNIHGVILYMPPWACGFLFLSLSFFLLSLSFSLFIFTLCLLSPSLSYTQTPLSLMNTSERKQKREGIVVPQGD